MTRIKKATKRASKLRLCLMGVSGSGKTFTALTLGAELAKHFETRLGFIDTERGSASKYADLFDFDVIELTEGFNPKEYISALQEFEAANYGVVVIDSLSHAWAGKDGILEFVDRQASRMSNPNKFSAWREATPLHNSLIDSMLGCPMHLITTMRSKTKYAPDKDERTGKTVIVNLGIEPVQRDGMEYEFDIVGRLSLDHRLEITKSRCSELADKVFDRPGSSLAEPIVAWLGGEPPAPKEESDTVKEIMEIAEKLALSKQQVHDACSQIYGRTITTLAALTDAQQEEVKQRLSRKLATSSAT